MAASGAEALSGDVLTVFANFDGLVADLDLVEQLDPGAVADRAFTPPVLREVFHTFATTVVFGHHYLLGLFSIISCHDKSTNTRAAFASTDICADELRSLDDAEREGVFSCQLSAASGMSRHSISIGSTDHFATTSLAVAMVLFPLSKLIR